MAHVELSLSEPPRPDDTGGGPRCWARSVAVANEPCLILDRDATIVAASASCAQLLGLGPHGEAIGRFLLDAVRLVDFTAARDALNEAEVETIPPLLAQASGRLARGLMRVYDDAQGDATVDAIATPLYEDGKVVGSLTFFAPI